MVVVVANSLPDRIRGRMKLWFVEPRANVFVSGISDHVALQVTEYLVNNRGAGQKDYQDVRPSVNSRERSDRFRSREEIAAFLMNL